MESLLVRSAALKWLTVGGTLFLSLATNLFASLWFWSHDKEKQYEDLLLAWGAIAAAYLGYLLFVFMEDADDVNRYMQTCVSDPTNETLNERVKRFVKSRLSESSRISLLRRVLGAALLWAFWLLLLIGKLVEVKGMKLKDAVFAGLIGLLTLSGCHQTAAPPLPQPVTIGYQEISLYRHLFTAKEKGFFDAEGLKVDLQPIASANLLMDSLLGNKLDAIGLTNLQVALTVEDKDPEKIRFLNFLVWREKSFPDYILTRKSAGIKKLKDLEGHTIGLHPGSAVRAFAMTILKKNGVDINRTDLREFDSALMQSAFVSGQVDALYCMDPTATTVMDTGQANVLVANPMHLIFDAPVPISGTVISQKFLRERPEDAKKLERALDRSIMYMREPGHEAEVASYIAKYTHISPAQALKMNISEYWTSAEIDAERVQALANRFKELNIVKNSVNVTKLVAPLSASQPQPAGH